MSFNENRLRKLDDEEWKSIPDAEEKYLISNYGRVKSYVFDKKEGRMMKPEILRGYPAIKLAVENGRRHWYLHKLVATLWLEQPSEEHRHVIHLDGNKKNNHISNLQWATKFEVGEHLKSLPSKGPRKKQINNSKLTERDVAHLKWMIKRGVSNVQIARMFCISDMQVTRIKRGENWGHVEPAEIEHV